MDPELLATLIASIPGIVATKYLSGECHCFPNFDVDYLVIIYVSDYSCWDCSTDLRPSSSPTRRGLPKFPPVCRLNWRDTSNRYAIFGQRNEVGLGRSLSLIDIRSPSTLSSPRMVGLNQNKRGITRLIIRPSYDRTEWDIYFWTFIHG